MSTEIPSKKKPAKTTKKRSPKRTQWHRAIEPAVLSAIIAPIMRSILADGVLSKTDFHKRLEAAISPEGDSVCIPHDTLERWLTITSLDTVFKGPTLYRLPTQPDTRLSAPLGPPSGTEDEDLGLDDPGLPVENLPKPDEGFRAINNDRGGRGPIATALMMAQSSDDGTLHLGSFGG